MNSEVPEPWATAMLAADLTDTRYSEPVPSMRRLADEAKTSTSTISAMIAGTRDTKGPIVQRVAVALGMADRADVVARWVGKARTQAKPFEPHRDADLLTSEEQAAVNEMIRLLALSKKHEAGATILGEGRFEASATVTKPGEKTRQPAARKVGKPPAAQRKKPPKDDDFEPR